MWLLIDWNSIFLHADKERANEKETRTTVKA